MARTYRHDNGLNKGRDDKPMGAKCGHDTKNPKGFNTFDDDHGHYGAGGSKSMKRWAARARRIYSKNLLANETHDYNVSVDVVENPAIW